MRLGSVSQYIVPPPYKNVKFENFVSDSSTTLLIPHHCSSCVFHKVTQYNNYSNFVTNKNEKNFELQSPHNFRINSRDISCLPLADRTESAP